MKLITEVLEDSLEYITEANADGEKEYFIEGIFMQANKANRNGRIYPTEVLEKEVIRYNKEYIMKNRAFGELGHPQGPSINLERVSHMIKELYQDGDNFIGKAKIMDSPYGNIVKNLIKEGFQRPSELKYLTENDLLQLGISKMCPRKTILHLFQTCHIN